MKHPMLRALLVLTLIVATVPSCASNKPRKRARAVQPTTVTRDTPPILAGTVGAQTSIRGAEGLLVSGYGIVVGLDGTGGREIPGPVRAFMEREMSLQGVGAALFGMDEVTPDELLNDPRTAVVIVKGVIPPGAVKGQRFDISVSAIPGSSATSLEGGTLWTTDLREGVSALGGPQTELMGTARGDLFINPFADPAKQDTDAIVRTEARILNGGRVVRARDLILNLDNPSHARARSIVSAVNAKWPKGNGREPAAKGVNEETILVRVPVAYADHAADFIEILRHLRVDQGFGRTWAQRYAQALRAEPYLADSLSWALQALGPVALPPIRDLYDYPEPAPRLAALRAGAALGDALVSPHLKELALTGPPAIRLSAIELLGNLGTDPRINTTLRELLSAPEPDVRVAAYEALARRGDPTLQRRYVEDKFVLDVAPSDVPMIYVSQQRQPRIVVFGDNLTVREPVFATGWDERLMLASEEDGETLRLYYRDYTTGDATTIEHLSPAAPALIQTLAHQPTPENPRPGMGLTYSEVVGALYELWDDGAFDAEFVAQQDVLAAELIRSLKPFAVLDRPETGLEEEPADASARPPVPAATTDEEPAKKRYVAPIPRNLRKNPPGGG